MPLARRHSDAKPAEQVLEDLLKPWPAADARARPLPKRPFAAAFLPHASHHAPQLPVFRMLTNPVARVELRLLPDRTYGWPTLSSVVTPSFEAAAKAVAARTTGSAWVEDAEDPDADEVSRLAPTAPQGSEDYRFAAQVVALKAAGGLDAPMPSSGSTPAGYADIDMAVAETGSAETPAIGPDEDGSSSPPSDPAATVDLDPQPGDVDQTYSWMSGQIVPSTAEDDEMPLPRSIFL